MKNFKFLQVFVFILCSGSTIGQIGFQSELLPISSSEVINFHESPETILQLPIDPTLSSPLHNEQAIVNAICFDYLTDEDDGSIPMKYVGQHPAYCQAVVHDKFGNVLFQIVDNNIYNRFGEGFVVTSSQTSMYDEYHYWLHQGTVNNLNGYNSLFIPTYRTYYIGEYLNREYCTLGTNPTDRIILSPEIIVVPVPESCNEFYLIYGTYKLLTGSPGLSAGVNIFYRRLTFYDHKTIEMTSPILLNETPSALCYENSRVSMAITEYRPDQENYILFLDDESLEIFEVTSTEIDVIHKKNVDYGYLSGSSDWGGFNRSEMEVVFDGENYLLAFAVSGNNPYYDIIKFPYIFSNIQSYTSGSGYPNVYFNNSTYYSANSWYLEVSSTLSGDPRGLEFTADGNMLFFTFENQDKLYYTDLTNLPSTPTISFINISNPDYFEDTHIELGRNGDKLYFQGIDGDNNTYLASLGNLSSPSVTNWTITSHDLYFQYNFNPSIANLFGEEQFTFMDQVDGSDYLGIATEFPEDVCCYVCDEWPQNISSPAGWAPGIGNNPFNSIDGTVTICDNNVIHQDELIQIDNMTFMFEDGVQLKLEAASNGQRGAILNLIHDNLFTSIDGCEDVWSGIFLEGDQNKTQLPITTTKQPIVRVLDNSIIENANQGIYSNHGGIVRTNNAIFKNNHQGVYIASFTDPVDYEQNLSYFITSDFLIDSELNGSTSAPVGLRLERVRDIEITGCNFKNTRIETIPVADRGFGIWGQDAGFIVKPFCSSTPQYGDPCPLQDEIPCLFEKWNYGITSSSLNSMLPITIERADFVWNFKGSYLRNYDYLDFIRNDFEVGELGIDQVEIPSGTEYLDVMYGAYFNECNAYLITENNFHDGFVGMYINNSGVDPNEVYKNYFSHLDNETKGGAFIALGTNSDDEQTGWVGREGLILHCNMFDENSFNISVIDGTVKSGHFVIDDPQNPVMEPVDNLFRPDCPGGETQFYVNPPDPNYFITYHEYDNISVEPNYLGWFTELCSYTMPTVSKYYYPFSPTPLPNSGNWEDRCRKKSFIYDGNKYEDLDTYDIKIDSVETIIDNTVDNGNSELLVTEVSNVNSQNLNEVKADLIEVAPFTSDQVLEEVIDGNGTFSSYDKSEVLIENSPLPLSIIDKVDNSDISQNQKAIISLYQTGISQRVMLENKRDGLKLERMNRYNDLVRKYFQNDSLPGNTDTLGLLIQKSVSTESKLGWIDYYRSICDYSTATQKLSEISSELNCLPSATQLEIGAYLDLLEILIEYDIANTDSLKENIVISNFTFLEDLASTNDKGYSIAQILLERYSLGSYTEDVPLQDNTNKAAIFIEPQQNNLSFIEICDIEVYPNPASDFITINYAVMDYNNKNIVIFDTNGKLIKSMSITKPIGTISVDISDLKSGIYLLNFGDEYSKTISIIR